MTISFSLNSMMDIKCCTMWRDDIKTLPSFRALVDVYGLFKQAQLDKPNLCILERQDRYSQRQYLWVWKGSIMKILVSSFLMISNRKIPVVGKASYGRDFLDNKRLTLRNIQVYCLLQVLSQNNLTKCFQPLQDIFVW